MPGGQGAAETRGRWPPWVPGSRPGAACRDRACGSQTSARDSPTTTGRVHALQGPAGLHTGLTAARTWREYLEAPCTVEVNS